MSREWRIGLGYDIHRLAAGRKLLLGGVPVPFELGLVGHSDADVVLHAVTDAVLGAAGLPDIGELFPDTDPTWKDADSRRLFELAMVRVERQGFEVSNIDIIIHAERPKLSAYKRLIAESVARLAGCMPSHVNVKAKTNEGMGPVGEGLAMACTVAAMLVMRPSA